MIGLEELKRQKIAKQLASDSMDDVLELQDLVTRWQEQLAEYCQFQTTDAAAGLSDALGNAKGELMKIEADLLEGP